MSSKNDSVVILRIPSSLKEAASARAAAEDRSLSSHVRVLLQRDLQGKAES